MSQDERPPISYLLLRDGHAVPIWGLSPDDIKSGKRQTLKRDSIPLKSTSCHNAIVHCLGFKGDYGDYKREHWDRVQRIMSDHGLLQYRNLFEVERNDLTFQLMSRQRRSLADRIFFGPTPMPRRVFTGFGHDWRSWSVLFEKAIQIGWRAGDDDFIPIDSEETREWIYRHRNDLFGNLTFFSDHLLDLGRSGEFIASTYFPEAIPDDERKRTLGRQRKVADALRWFIDREDDGWLGVIHVTDSLALLKGPDGTYDILWRNLRTDPPPLKASWGRHGLHPVDLPGFLQAEREFAAWYYFQPNRWEEKDRHEAELHHYASGGGSGQEYPGMDSILETLVRSRGEYATTTDGVRSPVPTGFRSVTLSGQVLNVSPMITVHEFRRFGETTGYFERRDGESWAAANEGNPEDSPVGATFRDALAYCAWMERELGVPLRLFTVDEHRAMRPFASEHYASLANQDFPWERFPPRFGLEPAVEWAEPRFHEPGPDLPEFPDESGVSNTSRKRWIAHDRWPPAARWRAPLPWVRYAGLQFIDAWDAYEWTTDGRAAGRFWEGILAPPTSWGEYKNSKVGFRLVAGPPAGLLRREAMSHD